MYGEKMERIDVTLIALDIKRWDLESQRLNILSYYVMEDEEKNHIFELSITQPPEMVEEYIGKIKVTCVQKVKNSRGDGEVEIELSNETFLRQKLYNYFKRILMELNNPRRKKGQSKMIFTTHMDVYNENQDISFLPHIIQFYVVLNWARKYYEKEDFQRAVEPLRQLIKIKPDFGLGYKLLARSLKKIRKYDEAMYYYEKYAEVDGSLDSLLDLAKSYRKGKLFEKSEKIYNDILEKYPDEKEAKIGLAQIEYARNDKNFIKRLEELYKENPDWVKEWLAKEFNFRIYVGPKTPLTPVQAARYLGFSQVFELTQRAFKNEIPSHFNPSRAKMSFFKEELDNWAMVMNHFNVTENKIELYPDKIDLASLKPVEQFDEEEEEKNEQEERNIKPQKLSTKVEEILRKIRETRARQKNIQETMAPQTNSIDTTGSESTEQKTTKRRRGRPPKKKVDEEQKEAVNSGETSEKPEETESASTEPVPQNGQSGIIEKDVTEEAPKRRRGRPRKKPQAGKETKTTQQSTEAEATPTKKRRGRPPKNAKSENNDKEDESSPLNLPTEKEFLIEDKN